MKEFISMNYHVTKACNAKCRFCYATFRDVKGQIETQEALAIIDALVVAGCEKLNFTGGEPTLRKDIGELIRHAKAGGLRTSIVTNGYKMDDVLDDIGERLDWIGPSTSSGKEEIEVALGRSSGNYLNNMIRLSERCRNDVDMNNIGIDRQSTDIFIQST